MNIQYDIARSTDMASDTLFTQEYNMVIIFIIFTVFEVTGIAESLSIRNVTVSQTAYSKFYALYMHITN